MATSWSAASTSSDLGALPVPGVAVVDTSSQISSTMPSQDGGTATPGAVAPTQLDPMEQFDPWADASTVNVPPAGSGHSGSTVDLGWPMSPITPASQNQMPVDPWEQFRADILGAVQDEINNKTQAMGTRFLEATTKLVAASEERTDRRLGLLEAEVHDNINKQGQLEADQREMREQLAALQRSLALAETATNIRQQVPDEGFAREVDITLLRISSKELLPKANLQTALDEWLHDADVDTQFTKLSGPESGRRFTLHFLGPPDTAARRLHKAKTALRLPGGTWRTWSIVTSSGATTSNVFIDVDKNGCQIAKERDARRLFRSFQQVLGDPVASQIWTNKRDGLLSMGGSPLALVQPENGITPSPIKWNLPVAHANHIQRDAIMEAYRTIAMANDISNIQWSG